MAAGGEEGSRALEKGNEGQRRSWRLPWAVGRGPMKLKLARKKAVPPPRMSQTVPQLWRKCWMWAVAISKGLLPLLKSEVAEGMWDRATTASATSFTWVSFPAAPIPWYSGY